MENSTELIQQLLVENARTNSVLEQMSDCFVAFDREWLYTHVNEAAESAFRMTRDHLLGKSLWKLWPPAYDLPIGVNLRRSMEERKPLQFECFYPEPLNRWFEYRCYPTEEGLATFFSDITDRKQTEEALRESEERFCVAQELSPDGFLILRPIRDDRGVVTDFLLIYENEAAARMNDTNPKGVCGMPVSHVLPHHDQTPFHKAYKEVAETGGVRVIEQAFYDQDTFRQGRWFRVVAVPTAGGDVAALVQDLTERKRAEEALAVVHGRLQSIIDNTTALVYALDLEERFVMANAALAELLKSTPEQMNGKKRHEFMPREEADWHEANDRLAIEAGRALEFEEYSSLKGGSITWLTTKFPLRDANGKIYAVAGISADISGRKRAEEQLRESEDALRQLNAELELRVSARTAELVKAGEKLHAERQRLFAVLETVPAMICLLTPDYHVAFANRSFREKFGEANGRHCYEYCFGLDKPCDFCESYKVLQTGQPHHWEVTGPADCVIEAHDYPFTDVDGSPMILEMDIDVTEPRKAEGALRELGAYNRTLIEASPDPLVTIGPDGRITDVNAATEHATGGIACNW